MVKKTMVELETFLTDSGASLVGFSNLKDYLPESLKELNFAITIGVRLSDFIVDEITGKPTYTYFHHYRTVNSLIDQITLKGMLYIMEKGFKASYIPASQTVHSDSKQHYGIFPHKTAANLAGLGWIGKSGLFITDKFGPRIRFGTILTDMELKCDNSKLKSNCGSCESCVKHCPAKAIKGNEWNINSLREEIVDAKACSDFMNTEFKFIGRGSVCGICVKVCPHH